MPATTKPPNNQGTPSASTERGRAYRDRLEEKRGKRLLIDINEQARLALAQLLDSGYGISQKTVVENALIDAANNAANRKT